MNTELKLNTRNIQHKVTLDQKWSENAPEVISEGLKFKTFLVGGGGGGHAPRPPLLQFLRPPSAQVIAELWVHHCRVVNACLI